MIQLTHVKSTRSSFPEVHCKFFVTAHGKAEPVVDVVDFEKIINEFALLRNKWLGIIKSLDIKQWQVSNIIKLRTAGLEDATL